MTIEEYVETVNADNAPNEQDPMYPVWWGVMAERKACTDIAEAASLSDTTGIAFASPESAARRIAAAIRERGK
jgi:hypothetical protein